MLGSNPGLFQLWHWQSDALTARFDLIDSSARSHPDEAVLNVLNVMNKVQMTGLMRLHVKKKLVVPPWNHIYTIVSGLV
jgi:hypothetical protein